MAQADGGHAHGAAAAVSMTVLPQGPAKAGVPVKGVVRLAFADGRPVTPADLRVVHTQKLHLLVIDPSLKDYRHLHPTATQVAGEYAFSFTPAMNGNYRLWADITPEATGTQLYARADMGHAPKKASPERGEHLRADVGGLHAVLSLEEPPQAHKAVMAQVTITKDGADFTQLEPVMGAFAHTVGFGEDFASVVHVHPMGEEPKNNDERGGPVLSFHLEPARAGVMKLFVQVRVSGEDIFFPFSVMVAKTSK